MEVAEPSPEETIDILHGVKGRYETHHRVRYTDETLAAAVQLTVQHIPGRFLPDKALDLIDEAGSRVRIQHDLNDPALRAHYLTLQQVRAHKAAALDADDMSKALALRQRELTLTDELDNLRADITGAADPPPVTPQDVADALALWTKL
jgi:ATP-dependent Clp protease ATP-binding subunit ClpC